LSLLCQVWAVLYNEHDHRRTSAPHTPLHTYHTNDIIQINMST